MSQVIKDFHEILIKNNIKNAEDIIANIELIYLMRIIADHFGADRIFSSSGELVITYLCKTSKPRKPSDYCNAQCKYSISNNKLKQVAFIQSSTTQDIDLEFNSKMLSKVVECAKILLKDLVPAVKSICT
ncbi:hypothetical protein HS5_02530 [Acidianus sp. HS-5]|nr:hypothetical protein HS5_02530 [Acidianus sp. HS-5]